MSRPIARDRRRASAERADRARARGRGVARQARAGCGRAHADVSQHRIRGSGGTHRASHAISDRRSARRPARRRRRGARGGLRHAPRLHETANAQIATIVQIESAAALEEVDADRGDAGRRLPVHRTRRSRGEPRPSRRRRSIPTCSRRWRDRRAPRKRGHREPAFSPGLASARQIARRVSFDRAGRGRRCGCCARRARRCRRSVMKGIAMGRDARRRWRSSMAVSAARRQAQTQLKSNDPPRKTASPITTPAISSRRLLGVPSSAAQRAAAVSPSSTTR